MLSHSESLTLYPPILLVPSTVSLKPALLAAAATLAPSPDNNQPWRLVTGDDTLEIQLDRSRSLPSDVNGMFDLTAIGCDASNTRFTRSCFGNCDLRRARLKKLAMDSICGCSSCRRWVASHCG